MPPKKQPASNAKAQPAANTKAQQATNNNTNGPKQIPINITSPSLTQLREILGKYSAMSRMPQYQQPEGRFALLESTVRELDPHFLALQSEQLGDKAFWYSSDLKTLSMKPNDIHGNNKTHDQNNTTETDIATYNADIAQKLDVFKNWIAKRCKTDTGVGTFVDFQHGYHEGVGLVAKQDVKQGQKVLSIPPEITMSVDCYDQDEKTFYAPIKRALPPALFRQSQTLALVLLVAYERLRGEKSRWKPYLDVLPKYVANIGFASFADILVLRGTEQWYPALNAYFALIQQYVMVINAIVNYNTRMCEQWIAKQTSKNAKANSQQLIQAEIQTALKTNTAPAFIPIFSILMYRWATAVVLSRQNPIPSPLFLKAQACTTDKERQAFVATYGPVQQIPTTNLVMLPAFDFGNHFIPQTTSSNNNNNTTTSAEDATHTNASINTHYNDTTKNSETFALTDTKAGEQLYIFYGQRAASQFAIYQGFIPDRFLEYDPTRADTDGKVTFTANSAAILPLTEDPLTNLRQTIRAKSILTANTFTIPYLPAHRADYIALHTTPEQPDDGLQLVKIPTRLERLGFYLQQFEQRLILDLTGIERPIPSSAQNNTKNTTTTAPNQDKNTLLFEEMWKVGYIESIQDKDELDTILAAANNAAKSSQDALENDEEIIKLLTTHDMVTKEEYFKGNDANWKIYQEQRKKQLFSLLILTDENIIPYTKDNILRGMKRVVGCLSELSTLRRGDIAEYQKDIPANYKTEKDEKSGQIFIKDQKNLHSIAIQRVFASLIQSDELNYKKQIQVFNQLFKLE